MAKKKAIEAPENIAPENKPAEAPIPEATESVAEPSVEAVPEEELISEEEVAPALETEEVEAPVMDFDALPVQAVEYLKRHSEVDAIYIDKFGGMFPKDTPEVFVKDAILYQNPYFKQ